MHVPLSLHLAVALLLLRSRIASANANGLTSNVCSSFRVQHTEDRGDDLSKTAEVELLHLNGSSAACFLPGHDYKVHLHASAFIKGFLLKANSVAKLPSTSDFPTDVNSGPCSNSVSHSQLRNELSDNLIFPIRIRNSRKLRFRYTVVFSLSSSLQDQNMEFPCCSDAPEEPSTTTTATTTPTPTSTTPTMTTTPTVTTTTITGNSSSSYDEESGSGAVESGSAQPNTTRTNTTTPHPPVSIITDPPTDPPILTPGLPGTPIDRICGKRVQNIHKSVNISQNGVQYNCTINKALKQTQCNESCDIDGEPVVCQVFMAIPRRKGYTCIRIVDDPTQLTPEDYIEKTFNEVVTTGCQCFATSRMVSVGRQMRT